MTVLCDYSSGEQVEHKSAKHSNYTNKVINRTKPKQKSKTSTESLHEVPDPVQVFNEAM